MKAAPDKGRNTGKSQAAKSRKPTREEPIEVESEESEEIEELEEESGNDTTC